MKRLYKYILICVLPALAAGCNKAYDVEEPSLEVSVENTTVKVGESVNFELSGGKLDLISFWSGETGSEYQYRHADHILPCSDMIMSFATNIPSSTGPTDAPNPATLPLSYSTDFRGFYVRSEMEKATWTDISDKFNFAKKRGQSNVQSGDVVINDLFPDKDSPVYFRYYYHVKAFDAALNNGRSYWSVLNSAISTEIDGVKSVIYDVYSEDWNLIKGDNFEINTTQPLSPNLSGAAYLNFRTQFKPEKDISYWMVSGPIYLKSEVNLGRDTGLAIKAMADPQMDSYKYVFKTAGEYTVTFVGINSNYRDHKEVVRSLKIKVVEDEGSIGGHDYSQWQ